MTGAAVTINYHNRMFRGIANSATGDVDRDTVFHYRQVGTFIWATYEGGTVACGTMVGVQLDDGRLELRYQHVTRDGMLRAGRCLSTPVVLDDGRLRLREEWSWTEGGIGNGTSEVEELSAGPATVPEVTLAPSTQADRIDVPDDPARDARRATQRAGGRMSTHTAIVQWERGQDRFSDHRYSRAHTWHFDGGVTVAASASPHVVPVPLAVEAAVDPEEAFVAALASCHMLWFLSCAARAGFIIDGYVDHAEGTMGVNAHGKTAIVTVTLRPRVTFAGERRPTAQEHLELHRAAHAECFISNSVTTDVRVEPSDATPPGPPVR